MSNALLRRCISIAGDQVPLWQAACAPSGISGFSAQFQDLQSKDFVRRLSLDPNVLELLFSDATMWTKNNARDLRGDWKSVELSISHFGAILCVEIDWGVAFSVSDLLECMHRTRATWSFGSRCEENIWGCKQVSIESLANWLVKMPWESDSTVQLRLQPHDYCFHHTFALLNGPYNPCAGHVLQVRADFVVCITREGVSSFAWGESNNYEQVLKIQSVLVAHCLTERFTLEKLSYLAALKSQQLVIAGNEEFTVHDLRRKVAALAIKVVRYCNSMVPDDCGGSISEHQEFFTLLRSVFRIKELKKELCEQVQDMLAIIDKHWLNEEMEATKKALSRTLQRDNLYKQLQAAEKRATLVMDVASNLVVGVSLPMVLGINFFSMNNFDAPLWVPWKAVVIASAVVSIVIVGGLGLLFFRYRQRLLPLAVEKRNLLQERASTSMKVIRNESKSANDAYFDRRPLHGVASAGIKALLAEFSCNAPETPRCIQDHDSGYDRANIRSSLDLTFCKQASSLLLLPFSFWPTDDKESPDFVVKELLERQVLIKTGQIENLWERTKLPGETQELSRHFKHLMGFEGSHVQRLRVRDVARNDLFSNAQLWGDTRLGNFVQRQCEWKEIHLLVFPHGAILSILVDWNVEDRSIMTLGDLRAWTYLAKLCRTVSGVTRGWSFGQRIDEFSTLYERSCISLSNVANWLVKIPGTLSACISNHNLCLHHSWALLEKDIDGVDLETYLYHISKGYGSIYLRPVPLREYSAKVMRETSLRMRKNCVISLAREGICSIEWNISTISNSRSFLCRLLPVFNSLFLHCLSERVVLDKLHYLLSIKDQTRVEISRLNNLFVRYRASMASGDCGGGVEARRFFKALRHVHRIADLKQNLFERLQDAEFIVACEKRQRVAQDMKEDSDWSFVKEEFELRKQRLKQGPKMVLDFFFFTSTAILVPFLLLSALWGSSQTDGPMTIRWNWIIIAASAGSFVLLTVFLILYLIVRVPVKRHQKELIEFVRSTRW